MCASDGVERSVPFAPASDGISSAMETMSHSLAARADFHLYCPVVRVQQDLGQGDDLGRSVPPIRAVYQDGPAFPLHGRTHQGGCFQHDGEVLQPTGAFKGRKPAAKHNTPVTVKLTGRGRTLTP